MRVKAGFSPLIIKSPDEIAEVTSDSPLLSLFIRRDTTTVEDVPATFIATARNILKPEKRLWDINVNINNGFYNREVEVEKGLTYPQMKEFMRARGTVFSSFSRE